MSRFYKTVEGEQAVRECYLDLLTHWPVEHKQHRLATKTGETFVIECGVEDRPALILLHGSMSNAAMWMQDVVCLAPYFHLYVIDIIGEPGLSEPVRPPLASDAYACWLDEVMTALSLNSASIVGISLGGWFALDYAIRRPERVDSLVLIVPGGVGRQKNVLLWVIPLALMGKWGKRKIQELLLGRPPEKTTPGIGRFSELMSLLSRHFRPRHEKLPLFSDDALAGLKIPVMAVVAGKDLMLDAVTMKRRIEANISDLELHFLPDARHFPGDQSVRILAFLRRHFP